MAYKFKPNKSVAKRFKVTGTGKLKHGHTKKTHLRSARTPKKKRHLGRPAMLFEGHARNMRQLMGVSGMSPTKVAHHREHKHLAAKAASEVTDKRPA